MQGLKIWFIPEHKKNNPPASGEETQTLTPLCHSADPFF